MTDTIYSENPDTISRKNINDITELQEKLSGLIQQYTESKKTLDTAISQYSNENEEIGTNINVFVMKDINPSEKYIKCAKMTSDLYYNNYNVMTNSYGSCRQIAIDKGSEYFGFNESSGSCIMLPQTDNIATSAYYEPVELWSLDSGQTTPCTMMLVDGNIVLKDLNGAVYTKTQNTVTNCSQESGGIKDIRATWGASCPNVKLGNATSTLNRLAEVGQSEFLYTIGSDMEDPSPSCKKAFDLVYKCGQRTKLKHIPGESTGQNVLLSCSDYIAQCQCFLILLDDGNMVIYKGATMETKKELIYSSATAGKQLSENEEWIASNGKGGKNWISNNSGLMPGEWIGNSTGTTKLIMQEDGKLLLLTSRLRDGCDDSSLKIFKLSDVDAVANRSKLGYVDNNSVLYEYPSNMIMKGKTFTKFEGYNSSNNNILKVVPDSSEEQCKKECTADETCSGFTFDVKQSNCNLMKDSSMFPRQLQSGYNMYVRNPELNNEYCPNTINKQITGNEWDSYIKSDELMAPGKVCGIYKSVSKETDATEAIKREMDETASILQEKINELRQQNIDIHAEMGINSNAVTSSLNSYNLLAAQQPVSTDTSTSQYIDSIKNLTKNNISYIFWSIFLIIALFIFYLIFMKSLST
jgi:hypothetical protein